MYDWSFIFDCIKEILSINTLQRNNEIEIKRNTFAFVSDVDVEQSIFECGLRNLFQLISVIFMNTFLLFLKLNSDNTAIL